MIRIGLLGGSFNPAHGGHRHISLFAREALGLDEVWWLVSPGNPLKPKVGMATLSARTASARIMARRAPIRVTALEQNLGTRYTRDTLRMIIRRWPKRHFVWLMGADNLAQFHKWKDWRGIACTMPIAVIARPGYESHAVINPAMAWLQKFRQKRLTLGRRPAWVLLRSSPDKRSATLLRQANPDWFARFDGHLPRDQVTRRNIHS